jgi:phospholipase/lecithinase/hemolysin
LSIVLFSTITYAEPVTNIVAFGDSLTDNGNLYEYFKHQIPPSPPYYQGRFSNGLIWVEKLLQYYYQDDWKSHLLDYAFGGAGVAWESSLDDGLTQEPLFSLNREVESYLLSHSDTASPNSLFAIWIGSNNYMVAYKDPIQTVKDVNKGIKKSLELLVSKGAKHILVINLPDMGKSPIARMMYIEKELSLCSKLNNEALKRNIDALRESHPDVQWILFDADKEFANVQNNPEKYGFKNTTDTCYKFAKMDENVTLGLALNMAASMTNETKSDNTCDGYFFFDPIHPTTLTHEILAKDLKEVFGQEGLEFK